jgi:hypothetical protein
VSARLRLDGGSAKLAMAGAAPVASPGVGDENGRADERGRHADQST